MHIANKQSSKLIKLIILSLLGTVSILLFFLNFPLPFLPAYLKIDFSDVPAMMASLIFSPIAGVIVVAIKNLLYIAVTGAADPIGAVANFLAGIMLVLPVSILYHRFKGVKSVISGLAAGTIIMALGMSLLNYVIILPAYGWLMGWEGMSSSTVKWAAIYAGILPFNIIKGIVIGMLFVPLFIKMRHWIEQKQIRLAP
ncbi:MULTISPECIES: ECF transporter S component [Virgibacillus]|uniref:Riboflavin transporter n=2 Tax=Virgibacillus TaxID=84406 RepID=A0A024QAH5_9BACI|nr:MULTISPECIES: ECF transporter S component [Virgibacillus]EQB37266.1 riboflavin transporter FmnP [Virgibacillus sp. CM-4]MYL40023.1 ECF transporter S component [Virgibacillus massiliensis]GGJ62778.1 riboflavin transporter FmnP [Virgibacillus kapii]CDQ39235.1 Riboflavin ECF transporter S component FmnP [Virgibacillus massiliensis]